MTFRTSPEANNLIVVFGYGPIGRATTALLLARGQRVRVAQRSRPEALPVGVEFAHCDLTRAEDVRAAAAGASQIVVAAGFAYSGKLWRKAWPAAMRNLVDAAESTGARVVFFDNLYMYGAQGAPLREDMPLTARGLKPAARAEATRIWMNAAAKGRVRFAALRAPDFYGPGVTQSHLGEAAFGALGRGKSAMLIAPPDVKHAFAYVPDLARNIVTLLDAPDDAYGQAWHAPCAPAQTPRQMLQIAAKAIGVPLKLSVMPMGLLPLMGVFSPFLRELVEMRFQWDRPYEVDWSKWAARFGGDVTPIEAGVRETALSFQDDATETTHAVQRPASGLAV